MRDFIRAFGGVPDEPRAAQHNTAALNHSFASLRRGDTLHIPSHTFHLNGGVEGSRLIDVVIQIDGTLIFTPHISSWPHSWG